MYFLVYTKNGQKLNLMIFSNPQLKNCISFISTFPRKWAIHTSSGEGYGSRNLVRICPPPYR
eukprot:UN19188